MQRACLCASARDATSASSYRLSSPGAIRRQQRRSSLTHDHPRNRVTTEPALLQHWPARIRALKVVMGLAANASRLASRPNRYSRSVKITQNLGLPATVFEAGRMSTALDLARLAASSAVTTCGEARSGVARKSCVKRASTKQEEKTVVLSLMPTEIASYFGT